MIEVHDEPLDGPHASVLVAELLDDLNQRYGPGDFRTMTPAEFAAPDGAFVVAAVDGEVAGCGGFLRVDDTTAELKRMFVQPRFRGRGVARALLKHLEQRAVVMGYHRLRLETGVLQPEAITLYRSSGYAGTARFAPYEDDERSICFVKSLT